jgi:hypothetical protein
MRFDDLHDGLTPGENGSTDFSVLAPVWRRPRHFRFTPQSRRSLRGSAGLKSAKSGRFGSQSRSPSVQRIWLLFFVMSAVGLIDQQKTVLFIKASRDHIALKRPQAQFLHLLLCDL